MIQGGASGGARGRCGLRPTQCILIAAVVLVVSVGGFGFLIYRNRYPNRFAPASAAAGAGAGAAAKPPALSELAEVKTYCSEPQWLPFGTACADANRAQIPILPTIQCAARAFGPNYVWFWLALAPEHLLDDQVFFSQLRGKWEENLVLIMSAIARVNACSGGVSGNSNSGCLFADAGANTGYLSMIAARNGMDAIAFEPLTTNNQALRLSLCLNRMNPTLDCTGSGGECFAQPTPNPDSLSVFARSTPPNDAASERNTPYTSMAGVGPFRSGRVELLPFVISDTRTTLEMSGESMDGHVSNSYVHDDLSEGRQEEMKQKSDAVQAKQERGIAVPAVRLDDWLLGQTSGGGSSAAGAVGGKSNKSPPKHTHKQKHATMKATTKRLTVSGGDASVSVGAGVTTLRRVTILKSDTEGHEVSVIRGAKRLLEAGLIDHIILEYNLWRGMTSSEGLEMLYYLDGLGYVCYDLDYSTRRDTSDWEQRFSTKYPRIPRDEFGVMTAALHTDAPDPDPVQAAKGLRGYRGRQWAINLYFTKTLPPHTLIPGASDDPIY